MAPSPIFTPGRTTASMPIHTSLPMVVSPRNSCDQRRGLKALLPSMPENIERVGGKAGHGVVGPVHDEFRSLRDGAEAPDDQPVADERIVVKHAFLDEQVRTLRVVVVGDSRRSRCCGAVTSDFRKPTRTCIGIGCFIEGLGPLSGPVMAVPGVNGHIKAAARPRPQERTRTRRRARRSLPCHSAGEGFFLNSPARLSQSSILAP